MSLTRAYRVPGRVLFGLSLVFCIACACFEAGAAKGGDEYYTAPQVFNMRPRPDREKHFGRIGVTGIGVRVYKGVLIKVESVQPDTPASGKFKKGQIIAGVNGVPLTGKNPFVALGDALNKAESADGVLTFDVKNSKGESARKVRITVPVLGKYSRTWPVNCSKSASIIKQAAEYYSTNKEFKSKHLRGRGIGGALTCLFLLSTGEDEYLPTVKAYFGQFPKDGRVGDHTWNNGYNGIACAEYYLRTGDKSVLPILQYYCDNARDRQQFNCSWNHWGYGVSPGYVAGGLMNPAGAQVVTTLLLGKECGVTVDDKTLLNALRFWYRFAGHGTVPYGDHRPEGGLASNGKDGMSAAIMQIASGAQGDTTIYRLARDYLSMSTVTSYPGMVCGHGDNGRGDAMWRGLASVHMIGKKPGQFHEVMNRLQWWYTLSRRPSGGFGASGLERFDDVGSGAGVAMGYTAHLRDLRITGAKRSPHAKKFTLPENLWGTAADKTFLSIEHNPNYLKSGRPEPIHVPFYNLGSAYSKPGDVKNMPPEYLVRNAYHARYMIRCQAGKALREVGAFGELEKLLTDPDPRARRAALDGMIDYRYWFGIGRGTIKTEQFTPAMLTALRHMIADPEEAWWVVDGALMAMKFAPAKEIGKCLPQILPWTRHEDWWLRESAFMALSGLKDDESLLRKVLPIMNKMMVDEYHTQPRARMSGVLRDIMKRKKSSPAGKAILASFLRAVKESEIKPNEGKQRRASEGAHNVVTSADVCLREAPETALTVARILQGRFELLETKQVIQLVGTPNSNPESKPFGLYDLVSELPTAQSKELEAVLSNVYLPELKGRLKAESGGDMSLINTIIDVAKLKNPKAGWNPVGSPEPADRTWRFISFDPQEPGDEKPPREKHRFRGIALPKGLEKWYMPEFDDSKWNQGKAPIGVGLHKRGRVSFENNSDWGQGEFLAARTTFELEGAGDAYDSYRLSILCKQGFHVYLNGRMVSGYGWWKDLPHYRPIMLGDNQARLLKRGKNVLAVYTNVEYLKGDKANAAGQIDLYIEGLKKSDLE